MEVKLGLEKTAGEEFISCQVGSKQEVHKQMESWDGGNHYMKDNGADSGKDQWEVEEQMESKHSGNHAIRGGWAEQALPRQEATNSRFWAEKGGTWCVAFAKKIRMSTRNYHNVTEVHLDEKLFICSSKIRSETVSFELFIDK